MSVDTIAGYAHVNIVVTDLEAAKDFYGGKFGFELLPRPDFGGFPGAWYRLGAVQLHLSVVERMPDWNEGRPHLALYIPTADFAGTIAKLEAAGVELVGPPRTRQDFGVPVQAAFCHDPDGNLIELTDVAPFS